MTLRKTLASAALASALLVQSSVSNPAAAAIRREYGGTDWDGDHRMKVKDTPPLCANAKIPLRYFTPEGPTVVVQNCTVHAVKGDEFGFPDPVKKAKGRWITTTYAFFGDRFETRVVDFGKFKTGPYGTADFNPSFDKPWTGLGPDPPAFFETEVFWTNNKKATSTHLKCDVLVFD